MTVEYEGADGLRALLGKLEGSQTVKGEEFVLSNGDVRVFMSRQEWEEIGVNHDVALPQPYFDRIVQATGVNPLGLVVWGYGPDDGLMGSPHACTAVGVVLIEAEGRFLQRIT